MSKRWPEKVIVGLTGNIATGKSTVMAMAAERGALALDADKVVHEILAHDRAVQEIIAAAFGPSVRQPDGSINRQALGAIVFADPGALRRLELIVHPKVRRRLFKRIEESRAVVVFIEAIKLLEGDLAAECDQIWVTRCPAELQIERLMADRSLDRQAALTRVKAQAPQEEKVARADVVIDTGGTLAQTRAYFELAWTRLMRNPSGLPDIADGSVAAGKTTGKITAGKRGTSSRKAPGKSNVRSSFPPPIDFRANGITVRRAKPPDVPSLLLLMKRATGGAVSLKRKELLMTLGDRGYLIGQEGTDISAIAGWQCDGQVARIEEIYVNPPEAAVVTGAAVLQEIEQTAGLLNCDVILAFPLPDTPEQVRKLFVERGFEHVDPAVLPAAWQAAVAESQPDDSTVMVKRLR